MHPPGEAQHLPVGVADLRILEQEVPEEAAAQESRETLAVRQILEPVAGRGELRRGGRGQRPLPHLGVRGGRKVDPPGGRSRVEVARERGDVEPRRRAQRVQEALQPALAVDEPVGARPHPELLAVVDHGDRPRPAPALEVAEALARVRERHQVAQPLVDREHRHRRALLLGQVVAAERLGIEPGEREVRVVDEHELHAGLPQHPRQLRLPDPLGQPHPARGHAPVRLEEVGERLDLADLVPVRQERQDRLVEAAPQQLHLPVGGQAPQQVEGRTRAGLEGLEQAPRAVHGQGQAAPGAIERLEEGVIGPDDRVVDDGVEVADRLVVVDAEEEVEPVVTHGPGPGA